MNESSYILIGNKLKWARESLLLTAKEVSQLSSIPVTTLRRVENGDKKSIEKWINELCYLYQINRTKIFSSQYNIPNWKILRRNVLAVHRGNILYLKYINKRPFPRKAIEFRMMQTSFINSYKNTNEIRAFLQKTYNWTFSYEAIVMALDSLAEEHLIEIENVKVNPRSYRKTRKKSNNILSELSLLTIKLEELTDSELNHSVTPAYDRMAAMLLILNNEVISRGNLYEKINYTNAYKNHQRSLKVLENLKLVEQTEEKPNSSKQKYRITSKGRELLNSNGI